ncbi:START domain-containing protein [Pseudomonas sp. 5P_3.1_Bac2]|uniref:START domain-containing protein n=1 Tax=Pseudomonas sp. 5P_3.1_Bac2 TaxID=2971617 RepID=UPI0021C9AECD|nr:START domain-containing protein [Pseudomonas sp. 5P_3.1_Bac2]MCU1716902.1 START domain-containing protein [Pseudomonas sp. 5P_3.1_Bac2]
MRAFVPLLIGCAAALSAALAQAAEPAWRLVKDEDGIKVYLQDVAGSKYQAYRGVVQIKAPVEKLRAMQEDVGAACSWIYSCKQQKLLKREGTQSWIYARFDAPWPVQSRDAVFHVTTEQGADGQVERKLEGQASYLPAEKGFVRVEQAQGFWRITPQAGVTEVVYQMHTEPGGSVPGWLANSFVVDSPFKTLQALRKLAEKP